MPVTIGYDANYNVADDVTLYAGANIGASLCNTEMQVIGQQGRKDQDTDLAFTRVLKQVSNTTFATTATSNQAMNLPAPSSTTAPLTTPCPTSASTSSPSATAGNYNRSARAI